MLGAEMERLIAERDEAREERDERSDAYEVLRLAHEDLAREVLALRERLAAAEALAEAVRWWSPDNIETDRRIDDALAAYARAGTQGAAPESGIDPPDVLGPKLRGWAFHFRDRHGITENDKRTLAELFAQLVSEHDARRSAPPDTPAPPGTQGAESGAGGTALSQPDPRPLGCRFRLADEGKAYPKSGCDACGRNIATGLGRSCHLAPPPPARPEPAQGAESGAGGE